ncbi:MAG: OmpA family protein, partial [Bacteroidia bacterium]|nr:OmpA family protein [Bacteroidia bacterium]
SVYAQKPAKGTFLPEAELNLNFLDRDGIPSFSNFELPTLRGRYFVQNDLVLRVDLNLQNSNSSTDFFENADGTGNTGTSTSKNGGIGFGVGIEKHLSGTNKLSPYIGFGVSYGMLSSTQEMTDVNSGVYQMDYSETTEQTGSSIGAGVLIGADYWVNSSFYVGTQINIGFQSQTINDGTTDITTGGTTTKSVAAGGKGFSYGGDIIPSFRIGFAIPSNGDAEGDADGDGVADSKDKCPGTPKGMVVGDDGCPAIVKEISMLAKNIYFETGSDVIKTESHKSLDKVALILNNNKGAKLSIEGHTDNVGDDAMNLDLSKRRAASVVKYLTSKGVDASRLSSEGYGETRPVADNATKDGQALNRRVEMILMF